MNRELDEKLARIKVPCKVRHIIGKENSEVLEWVYLGKKEIAAIKQAANEAGYIHLPNLKPGDYITVNGGTVLINDDGTMAPVIRMTGQEFYERFKSELKTENVDRPPFRSTDQLRVYRAMIRAARRAAGIEGETE